MAIILDMETDGLMPYCTKIHCAVAFNTETYEYKEFKFNDIDKLLVYLEEISQTETLSMHNGIGFDLKVLKKLCQYEHKGKYVDTLMMCRILWPDMEGGHSVEVWGERFGIKKPEHEDWSVFSPEMLHRCKEDVKIQASIYYKCVKEMEKYTKGDARLNQWDKIIRMEQHFWKGMEEQADYGWLFDVEKADSLETRLTEIVENIDNQLTPLLPLRTLQPYKDKPCKALKKDGTPTETALKWCLNSPRRTLPSGDFSRVQFERVDLNSSQQLKDFLLANGWTPKEYNFKRDKHNKPQRDEKGKLILTSPKTPKTPEDWEEVARQLKNPAIQLMADRGKASHRLASVKGLIKNVRADRRIEAQMNTCGTNTARATHRTVVNIPKAEDHVYFGREMRELFTVPKGRVLVGADASALEARCEAHYTFPFDKTAAMELLEGDIHTLNANAWDVPRSIAKNGKYAILYGAQAPKLAATLNKPIAQANELYETYWLANPALKQLKLALERQFESKGYLVAIDGRPLTIRYKHALLNTLLQSAGSIAMKIAFSFCYQAIKKQGIPAHFVGNFHDEAQIETLPEWGDAVGKLFVDSIRKAGEYLRFNVPLDGEYKIGTNWAETH